MDPSTAHRCLPGNRTMFVYIFGLLILLNTFLLDLKPPPGLSLYILPTTECVDDDVDNVAQIKHTTPTTPRRDNRQGSPSKNNDRPLGNQFIFLVVSKVTGSEQDQTIPASCSRFNRGHLQYLSSAPIGSCQNQISSQWRDEAEQFGGTLVPIHLSCFSNHCKTRGSSCVVSRSAHCNVGFRSVMGVVFFLVRKSQTSVPNRPYKQRKTSTMETHVVRYTSGSHDGLCDQSNLVD